MGENQINNTVNLFKTIYNDSPIGIEIYDLNGKLIDANQSCLELFGVSSKDDIKGFNLLNDPNIPKKYLTKLKQLESVRYENIFDFDLVKSHNLYKTTKSGKIYIDVLITPLFLKENKSISNYLVQVRDISAQKIAEQKLILFNEDLEKKIQEKIKRLKKLQANWRVLVEEAPDIILTIDRNGYILYINKDFLVKTREDVIGTNVLDYIKTKYHEIVKISIEKVFQTGEPGYCEISSIGPNNSTIWYSTRLGAIKEGEKVKSVMVLAREITEKKKIEQKLRESEDKFRIITEQSLMGIGILQDGLVKYASKKLAEIYGFSIEEILHFDTNRFLSLIDPEFLELVRAQSRKKQLGYKDIIINYEHKIIKKTGEKRWVENYSKSINYQGKSADLVINIDITNRKKAEQKLKESEEKYRKLFNNAPFAIALFDNDGYILDCNVSSSKITGYQKEELIGKNFRDFEFYPDIQKARIKQREETINFGDMPEPREILLKRKDKSYFWARTFLDFIHLGKVTYIQAIIQDITDRKVAESELKESEEKFRTIAEQSTLGILIQQDDEIKFVNKAFSEIIEYPMEEINRWKAKDTINVVYQEDLQIVKEKERLRKENDYDTINSYECRILTKSEKVKWVEIKSKAIRYLEKYALLISVIDTTARKKVEEQLMEIGRLKSELLSRTSHELKTPLVSIKGYTDLLLSQHYRMLDIYTISVLNDIKQGCHRLESLIQDLLETSKLESEEINLNKLEEDLAFLIRFCIRDLRGLLETRNHKLTLDIQNNMYTFMEKERIYEVIMNLLSNAIKYTPPNGQILIKSEIKEDKYLISIKDNGIGLTKDEKVKIFKKFGKIERYGKGMDVVSEGSGLGLYISKRIIDLHGGEIWVDSEGRNKGSTFFFSLPILKK